VRTELDHRPLGELLLKARLEKKLSRAQLSKKLGISENTLVRYEKAGLEDDGQYPQGSKLAVLCFELDISPQKALFGCLSEDQYWMAEGKIWEDKIMDHPSYVWQESQNIALLKDNYFLRNVLKKLIIEPIPVKDSFQEEEMEWMMLQLESIFYRQESFERRYEEIKGCSPLESGGLGSPGKDLNQSQDWRWIWDYRVAGEIPKKYWEDKEKLIAEKKGK
jgi:transcriptional regulator with XRE-family HTH domain